MDFIDSFFKYFLNNENKPTHKTVVVISIIMLVLFLDNTLNFSYHYNHSRKLEQIESINRIIVDPTILSHEKKILFNKRYQLLTSKTWKDKAYEYIFSINFSKKDQPITYDPTHPPEKTDKLNENAQRNYLIHFVTSSWMLLIVLIAFPFVLFANRNNDFITTFIGLIAMALVIFFFSWLFAKAFSYIPILYDNVTYNYLANAGIHGLIMGVIIYLIRKNNTEKNKFKY